MANPAIPYPAIPCPAIPYPTIPEQSRAWAVATVRAALRTGHLDLDSAERLLQQIYAAPTLTDLYRAIARLPHPPAPLVLSHAGG